MSKTNDLLPIVRTLYIHMDRTLQTNFHGFTRERLGEVIAHAEAVESGRVDSYCPDCGDLYCHCNGEGKNLCRYCDEIPEECECSRGGRREI
jgi:hypothetical protein